MYSIIIPTHNRPEKLKRAIDYYQCFDVNVIIVDSSRSSFIGDLPTKFNYYHRPDLQFADKILFGLTKSSTNLIALSADDDFLIKDALLKASDLMGNDVTISLSFGSFMSFNEQDSENITPLPMLHFNKQYYLSDKTKEQQIKHFMTNYDQILWSMYRKNTLEKAFRAIKESQFTNDNFIEICIATTAVYDGNLNIIKYDWGFREKALGEHWGARHQTISHSDKEDILKFVSAIATFSNKAYASVAINSYIKYSFVRKIKYKIHNMLLKLFNKSRTSASLISVIKKHDQV
jgi:glycosyltransferase domain-containing protein